MMITITIDMLGGEFLLALPEHLVVAARIMGRTFAEDTRAETAAYPPATIANRPGRIRGGRKLGHYQRDFGHIAASGKRYPTSEKLGSKWGVRQQDTARGAVIDVLNSASYWPYVHGKKQARFHGLRKWKRLDRVASEPKHYKRARANAIEYLKKRQRGA